MEIEKLAIALLTIVVIVMVASYFTKKYLSDFVFSIWKRYRGLMLIEIIGIYFLWLTTWLLLHSFIPILQYGWIDFFREDFVNLNLTPDVIFQQSSNWFIGIIFFVFLVMLISILPYYAKLELSIFTHRHEGRPNMIVRAVIFGLIRVIVLFSIASSMAFIILGLFLGYKFKKVFDRNIQTVDYSQASNEALMETTAYYSLFYTFQFVLLIIITLSIWFI